MGCDRAQGYYVSHPLPADELLAWIGTRPERHAFVDVLEAGRDRRWQAI